MVVKIRCPICNTKNVKLLGELERKGHKAIYWRCKGCTTAFQNKQPSKSDLKVIYNNNKYNIISSNHPRFSFQLNILRKYLPKGGIFLDVGCCWGGLLYKAREIGINGHGVEISNIMRDETDDLRVYKSLDDVEKKYDVITMFDVIEHMPDPRKELNKIKSRLKPNGKLIVYTPDFGSFIVQKILKKNWHYLLPNEHPILYSRKSLRMILEQEGFENMCFLNDYGNYIDALIYSAYNVLRRKDLEFRKKILIIAEV